MLVLGELINPIKKAQLFAVIFSRAPTYDEIKIGTPNTHGTPYG